ncbi:hypothetical protein LXL04_019004 [Taraxacum kok-saghyz]
MFPTSLNLFHRFVTEHSSGKFVKKKEVTFPSSESFFNGDDIFSSAAFFILHAHDLPVFQALLSSSNLFSRPLMSCYISLELLKEMKLLGHIITIKGNQANHVKVESLMQLRSPKTIKEDQILNVLNVHRCLVVFLLGTPDSTTNPNQRCHLLPSPPSRPEPHPTTAAIPIPGLSCSCGTTDLHLPPFSIAAGVGSSTIADAVGEENRRPSPPNLHHPLVYSSGDQGAANQFHRHLPPSLSVSLSLPDSCYQRRKATFTIELEASPSLKNTSTTVASPTRLHLSNRTADLLFFPSSEIGPGRGVDRVPSLVPDSNRFHAC